MSQGFVFLLGPGSVHEGGRSTLKPLAAADFPVAIEEDACDLIPIEDFLNRVISYHEDRILLVGSAVKQ